MTLHFQTQRQTFPPAKGSNLAENGVVIPLGFDFPGTVQATVAAVLSGFKFEFTDADHHIYQSMIELTILEPTGALGEHVNVDVGFLLRDHSGDVDDLFSGWVDVTLIVDL
jgi:hypothetical protein